MILAFSSGAVCFSAMLRAREQGVAATVRPASLAVAFVSSFIFFFQLRVADEFKDYEDDARWRPYRPVPRGLVTLRELAVLAAVGMAIQLAVALWLTPRLAVPLVIVWTYMALMTKEFWAHDFLRRRPFTTLWTHMLVVPLIDFYATACDWLAAGAWHRPRLGLVWFLAASFCNGVVVEIGRKVRAPEDEEEGVDTYSRVWGRGPSVRWWLVALLLTAVFALLAARDVDAVPIVAWPLGILAVVAVVFSRRMATNPTPGFGKRLELVSGLWTMTLYLGLGAVPFLLHR
jgi:4-hydroxybenzoate polyprenyltransferase